MENWLSVANKVKLTFNYDLAISLLDIAQREINHYVHKKTCSEMFVEVLFIKTEHRKHINDCQQQNEWLWYSPTKEHCWARRILGIIWDVLW